MSKESMDIKEGFSATVTRASGADVKPRHYWMGWALIGSLLAAGGYGGHALLSSPSTSSALAEKAGVTETLKHKIGGILNVSQIRGGRVIWQNAFPIPNQIINAGETALRDCFGGTGTPTCTPVQNFKYHGLGTSSAAIAETDTGCTTELTTQYNPDSTRATGTQTNNGANIYRTVATNTVDASATVSRPYGAVALGVASQSTTTTAIAYHWELTIGGTTRAEWYTNNTTTTPVAGVSGIKNFQWVLTGTGAVTQNVVLKGSFDSDGSNPTDLCTLTVSGTAPVVDACPPFTAPFPYLFVTTTVTTGTNASGTGKVGY